MDRLVTDNPQNNMEVMMNLAFVKDKEVWIHGGDEKGEDCTLIKFAERMCQYSNGCCHYVHGFPSDIVGTDIDAIGDVYMDCSMSGCPIGTAYFIAIQAAEMRERLREYEKKQVPILLENQHKPYGISTNANSPWISRCPKCGKKVEGKQTKFCKYCGQGVKWE